MSGEGVLPSRHAEGRHGRAKIKRGTVICPVCNADATIHGSERVTPLVKTMWCRCSNIDCAMSWRMQLSFEYVISPSGITHALDLPLAPADLQRKVFAPPSAGPAPVPVPEHDPNQLCMFPDHGEPLAPSDPLTPCTGE
ncbi:ogr/Delta-like zinc finger family protein [Altererythrobacter fulvus]|uniref:ogr/Delta-like zinc finger family protein n=1 Tax=Caenibius fulvus TaxID=2126012 RepID=UPI00301B36D2